MKSLSSLAVWSVVALLCTPAFGSVLVGPVDPLHDANYEEVHLYDAYNQIYGTNYTSSSDLVSATQVNFETISGSAFAPQGGPYDSLTLTALWRNAYNQQNVGYYTGTGSDSPNDYVTLLTVDGINAVNNASPDLRGLGLSVTWTPAADFGLFNLSKSPVWQGGEVVDYVDNAAWGPLHSEADENFYYDPNAANPPQYPIDTTTYPTTAGTQLSGYPNMFWESHFLILETPIAGTLFVAVEDLPYGHVSSQTDFNDFMFELTPNAEVVPEPATVALLGMGLAGVGVRRFRKRSKA